MRVVLPALLLGVACLASVPAHAQQVRQSQTQSSASQQDEAPWYERFTFGGHTAGGANPRVPRAEQRARVPVGPQSRWGVSVGVDQPAVQSSVPGSRTQGPTASAGVTYNVTPRARVGAAVTVPTEPPSTADREARSREQRRPAQPGVRVESAFQF